MSPRLRILVSCSAAYFSVGMINGTLGPLLPQLARLNGMSLTEAGLIFSAIFAGAVLSRTSAGLIGDRIGGIPILVGGILLQAIAALLITFSRAVDLLLVASFVVGTSTGTGLLGAVLLAAKLFPERSVSAVNTVNVFYGAGSIAGPALFSVVSSWWHTGLPVLWVAAVLGLSQLYALFRGRSREEKSGRCAASDAASDSETSSHAALDRRLLATLVFWIFGAVLLFDVGVESTIRAWTAVYLHQSAEISLVQAALVLAGFYVTFTLGRILAAWIGSRIAPRFLLFGGLFTALAGTGIVAAAPGHLALSVVGFLIAGFGIGPVYPTVVAVVGRIFGARAGAAIGIAGSIGFVGGVIFPWVAGKLMAAFAPVSAMRMVAAIVLCIILFSLLALSRARRRQG